MEANTIKITHVPFTLKRNVGRWSNFTTKRKDQIPVSISGQKTYIHTSKQLRFDFEKCTG